MKANPHNHCSRTCKDLGESIGSISENSKKFRKSKKLYLKNIFNSLEKNVYKNLTTVGE